MSIFDVEKQLTFYASYHTHKINVAIHMVCVPLIFWTTQVMFYAIPIPEWVPNDVVEFNGQTFPIVNGATVLFALFMPYYISLLPSAGILASPFIVLSTVSSILYAQRPESFWVAVYLSIGSWVAQFAGHFGAEGRAPALFDNLFASLFLAPFFVFLEYLFMLGFYPDFHKKIRNLVGKEVLRIRQEEAAAKRSKAT